jgi:hypothetical protein
MGTGEEIVAHDAHASLSPSASSQAALRVRLNTTAMAAGMPTRRFDQIGIDEGAGEEREQ